MYIKLLETLERVEDLTLVFEIMIDIFQEESLEKWAATLGGLERLKVLTL